MSSSSPRCAKRGASQMDVARTRNALSERRRRFLFLCFLFLCFLCLCFLCLARPCVPPTFLSAAHPGSYWPQPSKQARNVCLSLLCMQSAD